MDQNKVLIVEENEKRREYLVRFLRDLALDIEAISFLSEAYHLLLSKNKFSLLVINLPLFKGHNLKILRSLKKNNPRLAIIVLSKLQIPELSIPLLQRGIIDHLTSPDNPVGIFSAIKNELNKRELIQENEFYFENLRKLKLQHSKNIKKALELEEIYDTTLENLMTALDLRDVETFGHSRTVAKYSQVIAEILGIKDKTTLDNIRKGALLHDIGKIAIPDSILKKSSRLSLEEWEKIKLHPSLGFGLIKEIKLVKEVGNIILYHHEKYDGTGYPEGLKKEEIPLEARIFALADALDAITSYRPYRKERNFKEAKKEIKNNVGTQFDPQMVNAFCSLELSRWEKIRFETTTLMPSFEKFSELFHKKA